MKKFALFMFVSVILLTITFIYSFIYLKPSLDKSWESGFEVTPQVEIDGRIVTFKNLRGWIYDESGPISFDYYEETYNVDELERMWYLVEPFGAWGGIAHTYFVFDFKDKEPVVFSIEARREKGEDYSAFLGLFNKYELIYLWGSEKDITGRRAVVQNDAIYMYPVIASRGFVQGLFLELANETHSLESNARFYNTITDNCTNLLAIHANRVKPGVVKKDISWLLPGYADRLLYDLKYIPHDMEIENLREKYFITDFVRENYENMELSSILRDKLLHQ